jgi:ribonuclease BN (tRNA processing enzyme)
MITVTLLGTGTPFPDSERFGSAILDKSTYSTLILYLPSGLAFLSFAR